MGYIAAPPFAFGVKLSESIRCGARDGGTHPVPAIMSVPAFFVP